MATDINSTLNVLSSIANSALQAANNHANSMMVANPIRLPSIGGSVNYVKPSIKSMPTISSILGSSSGGINFSKLDAAAENWYKKFFPNLSSAITDEPDKWATGILSGSMPFGNHKIAIESAWQSNRDRLNKQANSSQRQLNAQHSLMGFSLPNGVLMASKREIETALSQQLSEASYQQAIKESDIIIELAKFAASTAKELKAGVMQISASYLSTIASLAGTDTDKASDIARARASAYSTYVSGLSNFNNVELGLAELRQKAQEFNTSANIERGKLQISAQEPAARHHDSRNQAKGVASKGFAEAAGAAASAMSTIQAELLSGGIG